MEHFLGSFAIPQACTSHSEEDELLKLDAQRWHKEDDDPQKDGQYTEVWKGNRLCKERKVGGLKPCPVVRQMLLSSGWMRPRRHNRLHCLS